jgi:RHS repeat-associated protein
MGQATPVVAIDVSNSGYPIERSACLTIAMGPSAAAECGNLRVVHPLPATRTYNKVRAPTLLYNSEFAHPWFLVPVTVKQLNTTNTPDSVVARFYFTVNGVDQLKASQKWTASEWPSAQTTIRRITVAYDAVNDTTGYYLYKVDVTNWYGTTPFSSAKTGGGSFFINRTQAAGKLLPGSFGNGWWLAGFEQIKNLAPGVEKVWIGGDGSARFFVQQSDTVWYTALYDKRDTLYYSPASLTWTKTNTGGVRTKFDATGKHIQTIDRFGRITQFAYYTSGANVGLLQMITLPAPASLTYTFNYTGSRLTSVTSPPIGGTTRVTSLTNSGGNLTAIQNPGDAAVNFAYLTNAGSTNLIAKRTNRRAVVDTFVYDTVRRVRSSRIKMSAGAPDIVLTLLAGESRGAAKSGTPASVDTVKAYTHLDGARTDLTDTTVLVQARFGPTRKIVDPLGNVTTASIHMFFGSSFGWNVDQVITPRGRRQHINYDNRGNVISVIDSVTPTTVPYTTRYAWDGKFDQMTRVVPPEGDSTVFSINATNGRREWVQDARADTGRVTFAYGDASFPEQVTGMTLPVGNGSTATHQFAYDPTRRNLQTVTSSRGFATVYTTDVIGRVISIQTPADTIPGSGKKTERRTGYDLLNRVLGDTTRTIGYAASDTMALYVRNFYNGEGKLDSLRRWTGPDPEAIGVMTNKWRYDNADRVVADLSPDTLTITPDTLADSTVYDPAGNVKKLISRRFRGGPFVTMSYDAANRLTQRVVEAYARPAPPWNFAAEPQEVLTLRGYPYSIPQEMEDFTYDSEHALLTATNRYARVARSYDVLGRMLTDSLHTARVDTTFGAGVHEYKVSYGYDRNGRLTSLRVPPMFAVGGRDVVDYVYHPRINELLTVTGVANEVFSYTYNRRREDTLVVYPGGYSRRAAWDGDGSQVVDSILNTGGTTGGRWPYLQVRAAANRLFDGKGKMWRSVDKSFFGDSTKATYGGLGLVATARFHQAGLDQTHSPVEFGANESFVQDALGNMSQLTRRDSLKVNGAWQTTTSVNNSYVYRARTGRLVSLSATDYHHDLSGNLVFEAQLLTAGKRQRAATYDAAGRLRLVDEKTVFVGPGKRVYEEYRYDALGRHIWVRMVSGCSGVSDVECFTPYIRRIVWAGDQELAEIQAPGADATAPAVWEQDTGAYPVSYQNGSNPDPNPFYGQALYVQGRQVDLPLSVTRFNYTDTDAGNAQVTWTGTQTIIPFWNGQGLAAVGAFKDGIVDRSYNGTASCTPGTGPNRCFKIEWLAAQSAWDQRKGNGGGRYWHGTLLNGKRDLSGLDYRRNRYYDPTVGRFTQEDPIGLAGGLNLYGFANGDPVNFADPFGLAACDPKEDPNCSPIQQFIDWAYYRTQSNAVLNALAGTDALLFGLGTMLSDPSAASPGGLAASGFASFRAFKQAVGPAGRGMQWHHVVGQTSSNIGRFGSEAIHAADNLIALDAATHARISGFYSSKQAFTGGKTVRDWLGGQSLTAQREFGMKVLRDFGVIR